MNTLWTEETIKNESIAVLLNYLKLYAIHKRDDYRNGESYQAEIDKIENEIKRRLTRYEARVCYLSDESDIRGYEKRGYAASCEAYREEFLTRKQAEADLEESIDYCQKNGWIVLESGIVEWGC